MKNDVILAFKNEMFGKLRAFLVDGEPWFVARDVIRMLGYGEDPNNQRRAIKVHVDEGDIRVFSYSEIEALARAGFAGLGNWSSEGSAVDPSGNETFGNAEIDHAVQQIMSNINPRGLTMINECGVYDLAISSRAANAKDFRRWVTHEVLPSIRKHGAYINPRGAVDLNNLPEDQRAALDKALQMYNNKLAGDEKRKLTNKAKMEADTMSDADILNIMSHRIGGKLFRGDIRHGVGAMYTLITNKMGIDFQQRRELWLEQHHETNASKAPRRAMLMTAAERKKAIDLVAWFCRKQGIDVDDLMAKRGIQ